MLLFEPKQATANNEENEQTSTETATPLQDDDETLGAKFQILQMGQISPGSPSGTVVAELPILEAVHQISVYKAVSEVSQHFFTPSHILSRDNWPQEARDALNSADAAVKQKIDKEMKSFQQDTRLFQHAQRLAERAQLTYGRLDKLLQIYQYSGTQNSNGYLSNYANHVNNHLSDQLSKNNVITLSETLNLDYQKVVKALASPKIQEGSSLYEDVQNNKFQGFKLIGGDRKKRSFYFNFLHKKYYHKRQLGAVIMGVAALGGAAGLYSFSGYTAIHEELDKLANSELIITHTLELFSSNFQIIKERMQKLFLALKIAATEIRRNTKEIVFNSLNTELNFLHDLVLETISDLIDSFEASRINRVPATLTSNSNLKKAYNQISQAAIAKGLKTFTDDHLFLLQAPAYMVLRNGIPCVIISVPLTRATADYTVSFFPKQTLTVGPLRYMLNLQEKYLLTAADNLSYATMTEAEFSTCKSYQTAENTFFHCPRNLDHVFSKNLTNCQVQLFLGNKENLAQFCPFRLELPTEKIIQKDKQGSKYEIFPYMNTYINIFCTSSNEDKTFPVTAPKEFDLPAGCRAESPQHVVFRGQNFLANAGNLKTSLSLTPADFLSGLDFDFDKNSTSAIYKILEDYAKLKPIKSISLSKLKQITEENSLSHYSFKFRYEIFTAILMMFSILFICVWYYRRSRGRGPPPPVRPDGQARGQEQQAAAAALLPRNPNNPWGQVRVAALQHLPEHHDADRQREGAIDNLTPAMIAHINTLFADHENRQIQYERA